MQSAFKKILCSAALLVLLNQIASAQQSVSVRVADEAKLAIASASVTLTGDALFKPAAATEKSDGLYVFQNVPPGTYRVKAVHDGYYPAEVIFELKPREDRIVEASLAAKPTLTETVTVTATNDLLNTSQTSSSTTLNFNNFPLSNYPPAKRNNLSDVINSLVQGAVASHDNLTHLRGNELSLNTFINGVSFFDNPHSLFTVGLPPDIIQSANVVTGGFAAEYGNRFGGAIDIVTKSGFSTDNHGSISAGFGNYLRDNVSAEYGGHTERFGYYLYAAGFQSSRFLNPPEPIENHDFGRAARAFAQLDYKIDGNDSLRLTLLAGGSNFQLPNTLEQAFAGRDFFQRNRDETGILTFDHIFSSNALLTSSLYTRSSSARILPTSDPASIQTGQYRQSFTAGGKIDLSYRTGSRHYLKFGADFVLLSLRENVFFDPRETEESEGEAGRIRPNHESDGKEMTEIPAFDFRGRNNGGQISFYAQDKLSVSRNLTVDFGLRYDQYNLVTSNNQASPRVGIAYYIPSSRSVLHFTYNRFFAPPPIENLLLAEFLGFSPPKPMSSNYFEAGIAQEIGKRARLSLNGYYRTDRNPFELTEIANVRIFLPTNFRRGRAYGGELSLNVPEIPKIGISGYFNYAAQRAFFFGPVSGGFSDENAGFNQRLLPAFDQIQTLTAGISHQEKRTGLSTTLTFEYATGTPSEGDAPGTIKRLPDHFAVNFYSGIKLFKESRYNVTLQFAAENLTDRVYGVAKESEITPIQFSLPRTYSASLKFGF